MKPAPGSVLFLLPPPQPQGKGPHLSLEGVVPLKQSGVNQRKMGAVEGKQQQVLEILSSLGPLIKSQTWTFISAENQD